MGTRILACPYITALPMKAREKGQGDCHLVAIVIRLHLHTYDLIWFDVTSYLLYIQ